MQCVGDRDVKVRAREGLGHAECILNHQLMSVWLGGHAWHEHEKVRAPVNLGSYAISSR